MGTVVTKDVGSYEILGGNPARLIRRRFDDKTCEALEKSKWWERDPVELREIAEKICDVEKFLSEDLKDVAKRIY